MSAQIHIYVHKNFLHKNNLKQIGYLLETHIFEFYILVERFILMWLESDAEYGEKTL